MSLSRSVPRPGNPPARLRAAALFDLDGSIVIRFPADPCLAWAIRRQIPPGERVRLPAPPGQERWWLDWPHASRWAANVLLNWPDAELACPSNPAHVEWLRRDVAAFERRGDEGEAA